MCKIKKTQDKITVYHNLIKSTFQLNCSTSFACCPKLRKTKTCHVSLPEATKPKASIHHFKTQQSESRTKNISKFFVCLPTKHRCFLYLGKTVKHPRWLKKVDFDKTFQRIKTTWTSYSDKLCSKFFVQWLVDESNKLWLQPSQIDDRVAWQHGWTSTKWA